VQILQIEERIEIKLEAGRKLVLVKGSESSKAENTVWIIEFSRI